MKPIENGMRPIHLGEVLREEFLLPLGMSGHALALARTTIAESIAKIVSRVP